MRPLRLDLLLLQTSLMRPSSIVTVCRGRLRRVPASCLKPEKRALESSALSSALLLALGQCQSAVLLGSSERRTSGSWRAAQARPRRALAGLVSEPASET